jgi:putative ABC transport system permease protein
VVGILRWGGAGFNNPMTVVVPLGVAEVLRRDGCPADRVRCGRRRHAGRAMPPGAPPRVGTASPPATLTTSDLQPTQLLEAASSISGTLTLLLGGIASISLVVGGIGIMNIMLVSVRERTREIGIRKAVGARSRDILAQFLIEALTLSVLGGLIGIVIGLAVSALIGQLAGWAFVFSPVIVAVALVFSLAVGVVFGVWPARQAARLDPISALRWE